MAKKNEPEIELLGEELSEQISRGINNSAVGQFFQALLYALICIGAAIIILFVVSYFYNYYHPFPESTVGIASPNCNYPYVYCEIDVKMFDVPSYEYCKEIGFESLGIPSKNGDKFGCIKILRISACGYQEANALFEQIKNNYDEDTYKSEIKSEMECNNGA